MAVRLVFFFLAISFFSSDSYALEVRRINRGDEIHLFLSGSIESDDATLFERKLSLLPYVTEIHLDSPGGVLRVAIKIGRLIRKHNIATRIDSGSKCYSACPYIFIGGILRAVEPGGRIGVHMASIAFTPEFHDALRKILTQQQLTIEDRISLLTIMIEQHASASAANQILYIQDMGVSVRFFAPVSGTLHLDMYEFRRYELERYNIIN